MGFFKSVTNFAKNPINLVSPMTAIGGVNNRLADMLGIKPIGGGGNNNSTTPGQPGFDMASFLKNPAFQFSNTPQGPGLEDNSAAYQKYLDSTQAATARGEQQSTANVLDQLQGRGIADSGIALKDVVSQVLGPSLERQNNLAAQFGLAQAQNASDVLGQQRQAANALNQSKLQGMLGALGGQQSNAYDNQMLQAKLAAQGQQQREALSRQRKGGLFGLLGGIGGGLLGGPEGAYVGNQMGQGLGAY